jgi:ABC-2 type transport system permease protein
MLINDQTRAIVWAQWRTILNRYPRGQGAAWFTWIFTGIWYLGFAFLAYLAATLLPKIPTADVLERTLSVGLAVATGFWQVIPLLMVSAGMSLDLKRIMVYPVPVRRLFGIEVLLRTSTAVEPIIVLVGVVIGVLRSPVAPPYGVLAFIPFVALNLLFSAGLRDLLTRLMARKGIRELVVLAMVFVTVLPQFVINMFPPETWKKESLQFLTKLPDTPWPWKAAAGAATMEGGASSWLWLLLWAAAAYAFGMWQFQRGLRWDASEARARDRKNEIARKSGWKEWLYCLPSRLLPDPLGSLIEKEFRFLSRAPRFRLVFFMGFSFGLLIWAPIIFGRNRGQGFFGENFLVLVCVYAALLLGEVPFWNCFGFDRLGAQAYFIFPVPLNTVLFAKNITAVLVLLLEVTLIALVCLLFRVPLSPIKIADAYAVAIMICVFLLAAGNLTSSHSPRAVDPEQSWRNTGAGKTQFMLMLVYPALFVPITLAYLARYAFDSHLAFYAVVAAGLAVGALMYSVSLESSISALRQRKEDFLAALGRMEGPIG